MQKPKCPHCGKEMSSQASLRSHVRISTIRIYCPLENCPESQGYFLYFENYKNHARKVHKLKLEPPKPQILPAPAESRGFRIRNHRLIWWRGPGKEANSLDTFDFETTSWTWFRHKSSRIRDRWNPVSYRIRLSKCMERDQDTNHHTSHNRRGSHGRKPVRWRHSTTI